MSPRKTLFLLGAMLLCTAVAFGQSSGNFTYANSGTTHCVLQQGGSITGGATCSQSSSCTEPGNMACTSNADCGTGNSCDLSTGQCVVCTITPGANNCAGTFKAAIKTSSGSGNVFVIQPSAVIGLLTDVSLQKNSTLDVGTSSAYAGVDFGVNVTDPSGKLANTIPNFPVTYAARYIQISSNLFDAIATQCTTTSTSTSGSVGITAAQGCFINFNESTVSAHSFQWIVPTLSTGTYNVAANWQASLGNTGISQSLTCVGPVNVTVQQNKVFSFNGTNTP
jgi:hypothetical protein